MFGRNANKVRVASEEERQRETEREVGVNTLKARDKKNRIVERERRFLAMDIDVRAWGGCASYLFMRCGQRHVRRGA